MIYDYVEEHHACHRETDIEKLHEKLTTFPPGFDLDSFVTSCRTIHKQLDRLGHGLSPYLQLKNLVTAASKHPAYKKAIVTYKEVARRKLDERSFEDLAEYL